jgi:hypothetical protein
MYKGVIKMAGKGTKWPDRLGNQREITDIKEVPGKEGDKVITVKVTGREGTRCEMHDNFNRPCPER